MFAPVHSDSERNSPWRFGTIRRTPIESDREMPGGEKRKMNRAFFTLPFEIHPSKFGSLPGRLFHITRIPVRLRFCGENYTLDSMNDASLFGGETELSLVA